MTKEFQKIYKYTAIYEPAENGGYVVSVPALPGCVTQGENFEDARKMAEDAIKGCIAVLKEDGDEVPIEPEGVVISEVKIANQRFI